VRQIETTRPQPRNYFLCPIGRLVRHFFPTTPPPWALLCGRGPLQRIRAAAVPAIHDWGTSPDPEPTRAHAASPFSRSLWLPSWMITVLELTHKLISTVHRFGEPFPRLCNRWPCFLKYGRFHSIIGSSALLFSSLRRAPAHGRAISYGICVSSMRWHLHPPPSADLLIYQRQIKRWVATSNCYQGHPVSLLHERSRPAGSVTTDKTILSTPAGRTKYKLATQYFETCK